MRKRVSILSSVVFFLFFCGVTVHWGFWAHKRINRLAVFRLPAELQVFYKKNIDFITENAVNPDRRRYAVVGEAERHFIDLEVYGDSAAYTLPVFWKEAVAKYGEDSLRRHGIAPWYIQTAAYQLTEAFKVKDARRILRISADLGHYVADIHVPLHTTRNYNGQLTGQEGIHAFWESRLPELYADHYQLWIGEPVYINSISAEVWRVVHESHSALDSVFQFERKLSTTISPEKKYSYELRNNILTRSYSREFSDAYHRLLSGQVERRMKSSVRMVGNLWYTCWVNAGQPDLKNSEMPVDAAEDKNEKAAEPQSWLQRLFKVRPEADD
ncbi:hypothetical protein DYBT9275_02095 [Dyadobacter sp. CECT 9275]|uniref:S1/P1 Nuclease n=1 Tax=Dyadobacter helix TaxID=2822344 RepID=A0A916JBI0_9BACT|nr:zinc dependent phospholipase C family protein [Dyadobacter sp. CECT 9275]CAG4998858.1 hypothetical protein DYBT9275_02095 [Dyadobacter sp. CECT 9275]